MKKSSSTTDTEPIALAGASPLLARARTSCVRLTRMLKEGVCGALLSCTLLFAQPTVAQTAADKAAAQVLFDAARKLFKAGDYAGACPKFAESYDLEETLGTLLNLARCYESDGKLASAWVSYNQVAMQSKSAGELKRAKFASRKAADLKPQLSTLTVEVPEPVEGMTVRFGDDQIPRAVWGSSLPVDAGQRTIVAEAPGKQTWRSSITIEGGAAAATVTIAALEDVAVAPAAAPVETKPDVVVPPPHEGSLLMPVLGWVGVGVGLAGVGAGVALRVMALNKDSESEDNCLPTDDTQCNATGVALRDEARSLELGSLIAFIAGGVVTAAGVVVVVLDATSDGEQTAQLTVVPSVGPDLAGFAIEGRF